MLDGSLKARFCKDMGIKINVFSEPYFTDRLMLFGKTQEYNEFNNMILEKFKGEADAYIRYCNDITAKAVEYIRESSAFKSLNSCDMSQYSVNNGFRQGDIYKYSFVGKNFISIDMCKANFSSIKAYAKLTGTVFVKDDETYEAFISRFTDIKYLHKSKLVRQIIFGKCNSGRFTTFEKYIMNNLLIELNIDKEAIISFCNDEIILDRDKLTEDKIKEIKEKESNYIVPLKVEEFRLLRVDGISAFVKEINTDNGEIDYEIKGANPVYHLMTQRLLANQPIKDDDLVFFSEYGRAKLTDKPVIKLVDGGWRS